MNKYNEDIDKLSLMENQILLEIFQKSVLFLNLKFIDKYNEKKSRISITDSQIKSILKTIWDKKANSYFDGIENLKEYNVSASHFQIVNNLINKGLIRIIEIENNIYEEKHLIITIPGIEKILKNSNYNKSISQITNDILINDKIEKLNQTCKSSIKKEYSIILLILIYFGCGKTYDPIKVINIEDRRYLRLCLNEFGKELLDENWNPLEEKNFYQKFYNEIKIVYYQTGKLFRYESGHGRDIRIYGLKEKNKNELRKLCFKIFSSLTSDFKYFKIIKKLSKLSYHISKSLNSTPVKDVPITVEDMLRKIGVKNFVLKTKRKRVIEEIFGQIAIMKEKYRV